MNWLEGRKEEYLFNSSGYLIDEQRFVRDFEKAIDRKEQRTTYYLDYNNKIDSIYYFDGELESNNWIARRKTNNFYENEILVNSESYWCCWKIGTKNKYYYNQNDKNSVIKDSSYSYNYYRWYENIDSLVWNSNNLLTEKFRKHLSDTGWTTTLDGTFQYDSLDRINLFWDSNGIYWKYTYDKNGNIIFKDEVYFEYNEWKAIERYEYIYDKITEVKFFIENKLLLSPNPATDYIEIKLKNVETALRPASEVVEIFDVLGQTVAKQSFNKNTPLSRGGWGCVMDVSHLQPGIYFIRAGNEFLKFVKI